MDVVYVVRTGDRNDPLRWSLRSLAHLPHGRVWIVGHRPPWVTDARHLPTVQAGSKWANTTGNWRAALACTDISDPFILFNDDFFVMRPCAEVPSLHRGPIPDVISHYRRRFGVAANRPYLAGMVAADRLLARLGCTRVSYELHAPIVVHKGPLSEAIDLPDRYGWPAGAARHTRTLYGNVAGLGGDQAPDCKVSTSRGQVPGVGTFLSTSPSSWKGPAGDLVRDVFPAPGPYEMEESCDQG